MPLLLIRHGQSEGNVQRLLQRQADHPLTEQGREQAQLVAARIRDGQERIDRIVASPLARAFETAQAIGEVVGLPVTTDERLLEYDFGEELSGLTVTEVRERYPNWSWMGGDAETPGSTLPDEEGMDRFIARVAEVVKELVALDGYTVAVSHGGVIMSSLNATLQMHAGVAPIPPWSMRFLTMNCAITELDRDADGRLILKRHNEACHLPAAPLRPF